MTEGERNDLINEARILADELSMYIQMEEMLTDIGADPSAYTEMKRNLLDS